MQDSEQLRRMLRALSDVSVEGDRYEVGNSWDLTLHVAYDGVGMSIQQVTAVRVETAVVVAETAKGSRYVLQPSQVHAVSQEPGRGERSGRRAGFSIG